MMVTPRRANARTGRDRPQFSERVKVPRYTLCVSRNAFFSEPRKPPENCARGNYAGILFTAVPLFPNWRRGTRDCFGKSVCARARLLPLQKKIDIKTGPALGALAPSHASFRPRLRPRGHRKELLHWRFDAGRSFALRSPESNIEAMKEVVENQPSAALDDCRTPLDLLKTPHKAT
ncbi:hypothetical protein EVAR_38954_1 [Eumeta japonica]|uniref:Uncharacterized protein n=1 Tax=Eumeta variegata TaxID=151549 RepID=A0A4C1W8J8_EUMVA|nr:hypothetical protein EVAR_38954_1 [Eumeta japonica]